MKHLYVENLSHHSVQFIHILRSGIAFHSNRAQSKTEMKRWIEILISVWKLIMLHARKYYERINENQHNVFSLFILLLPFFFCQFFLSLSLSFSFTCRRKRLSLVLFSDIFISIRFCCCCRFRCICKFIALNSYSRCKRIEWIKFIFVLLHFNMDYIKCCERSDDDHIDVDDGENNKTKIPKENKWKLSKSNVWM